MSVHSVYLCLLRVLLLRTVAGFADYEESYCNVRNGTQHYNFQRLMNRGRDGLEPLQDTKSYHAVAINQNVSVILAVCQSLIGWDNYKDCGASNVAICLVDQSEHSNIRYTRLGEIGERAGPNIANDGTFKIYYENGSVCDSDDTKRMRSTIKFICDLNAKESYAEYVGGLESCDLLFIWKTAVACSKEALMDSYPIAGQPCQVTDPVTGYIYDLSDIPKVASFVWNEVDNYGLNVRLPIFTLAHKGPDELCKMSMHDDTNSMVLPGKMNSRWSWLPGRIFYWDFSYWLPTEKRQNLTRIEFYCLLDEGSFEEPLHDYQLIHVLENGNSTRVLLGTSQVCPKICLSFRYKQIDNAMGSAIGQKIKRNNRVYSFDNYTSYLENGYECTDIVVGIRLTTYQSDGSFHETSLGYSNQIPTVTGERISTVKFVDGDPCKYSVENEIKISSQISLICDVGATKSLPQFDRHEDCSYYFDWRSRQHCGIVDSTINVNCTIENELGHRWNLMPLREKFVHTVQSIRSNTTYDIQICGKNNATKESSIFTKETNYGKLFKVSTDYAKNMSLKLYFSHGTKCANGSSNARSVLYLVCDEARDIGEPEILWEEECSVGFEWRTNLVCFPETRISQPGESSWVPATTLIFGLVILLIAVLAVVLLSRNAVSYKTLATNVRSYGSCGY